MTWGWAGDTVTRIRVQELVDAHGDTSYDWPHANQLVIPGVSFAPREDGDGGTVYAARPLDIAAGDHLLWRGRRFRVVGIPQVWAPGTVVNVEGVDIPGQ